MKRLLILATAASALSFAAAAPASAQYWQSINQRQAALDHRIDTGVRNGALTQQEAILLRGEFRTIANLEAEYRRSGGGLSQSELGDLDRRFDTLNRRIRIERFDGQGVPMSSWQSINQRQAMLDQRIDASIRAGALTPQEAILLRGEFRTIANLEAEYRRSGGTLSQNEIADLDRRFDNLAQRIRLERTDGQGRTMGWQSIDQRQAVLESRIETALRDRHLTQQQAILLRGEFRTLADLEAQYRRSGNGLSQAEEADLNNRFDILNRRIRIGRDDFQGRPSGAWQSINQRQAALDARIDQGYRNRALTEQEAILLRGEFRTLANLEAEYRRSGGGLSQAEEADLDRRFDMLDRRIRVERTDGQGYGGSWQQPGWLSINQRQAALDARIERGIRNREFSPQEAFTLRSEFRNLANLEAEYRRSGGALTTSEVADLDRRFDMLAMRIRLERSEWQVRR